MLLIADSGSTKTSWMLAKSKEVGEHFKTIGYNPHFISVPDMQASLETQLLPQIGHALQDIEAIHFYGAGCSTPEDSGRVLQALKGVFPSIEIHVEHDLLAAARALCGHEAGVACILGTGSNSCLYDGNEITDNVDSLGFTLGDEGSGGELGRRLVKSYFYRDMPSDLVLHFREKYQMSKADFFEHVYRKPLPNRFLASFSTFCSEHIEHPFIQELIRGNFDAFITTQVLKYEGIKEMPVHFIGSIAQVFQEQLEEVLAIRGLKLGKVIRNPINNLLAYHLS